MTRLDVSFDADALHLQGFVGESWFQPFASEEELVVAATRLGAKIPVVAPQDCPACGEETDSDTDENRHALKPTVSPCSLLPTCWLFASITVSFVAGCSCMRVRWPLPSRCADCALLPQ